ncbi:hypothetical protein [Flammeovirga aprica]|uniref:Outer membrane protein beta-barrel domain-containing protein n=1 Tax=Flammeovirga aprica JL-4 TaxID=694437 RepID=A0A7X9P216_9BACT|nr:hypothetical protein [Flammeovirga aprica]NME68106.1 hypothetical protein [Flammeovirga aprica JL-4]
MMAHYSFSQNNPGIYLSVNYDLPLGTMGQLYNPAFNYEIGVRNTKTFWVTEAYLNHSNFTTKQDIFYFLETEDTYGHITSSDLKLTSFGMSTAYLIIPFNKKFTIDVGIFLSFTSVGVDLYYEDNGSKLTREIDTISIGGGPKVNINFLLTDHLNLSINNRFVSTLIDDTTVFNNGVSSFQSGIALEYRF